MVTLTPEQVEDGARAMPDHAIATAFLAPEARARMIALILFAHEISRARGVVSEAGLAAIRLQWWRDSVAQIYAGQTLRAQPTVIALAQAIEEASLPRSLLDGMIDGHEHEIDAQPFATWSDLEAYLDATYGNFHRLALLASGFPLISTRADDVARYSGTAWGLAHLLKSMPNWSARRSLWLPQETSNTLDTEAIFAGQVSMPLRTTLGLVKDRIASARNSANASLKDTALGAHFAPLAPASLAQRYAKAALPNAGDIWTTDREVTLLERQIRITISVARGRL